MPATRETKSMRSFDSIAKANYLAEAFSVAADWHATQLRKGTSIPYVSHLMGVAALVLEYGGDLEQSAAALLHDSVEDSASNHEAARRKRHIQDRFGDRVLRIVEGCTDGIPDADGEKPEWTVRKQAYLTHLEGIDADVLLVSAADKLHNARAILGDIRSTGDEVFTRFTAGKDGTLWYYGELARVFKSRLPGPLSGELVRTVVEMASQARSEKNLKP